MQMRPDEDSRFSGGGGYQASAAAPAAPAQLDMAGLGPFASIYHNLFAPQIKPTQSWGGQSTGGIFNPFLAQQQAQNGNAQGAVNPWGKRKPDGWDANPWLQAGG